MNTHDRIAYAQMTIDYEWSIEGIIHVDGTKWEQRFLNREDVDPLNVHKPYGFVTPQLVQDEWYMPICVPIMLRPVRYCTDQDLSQWLAYWLLHMEMHLRVLARAVDFGEHNLDLSEIEERVEEMMDIEDPQLQDFAKRIKSLSQME